MGGSKPVTWRCRWISRASTARRSVYRRCLAWPRVPRLSAGWLPAGLYGVCLVVIDGEHLGQARGSQDALDLAGRRGQRQAAASGTEPVPDADEDAEAGRVDKVHAG